MRAALAQRFDKPFGAARWRGTPIAGHEIDVRAALAKRVRQQLATAFAAKHDDAPPSHVRQFRQREQAFAVERRARHAHIGNTGAASASAVPGPGANATSDAGQRTPAGAPYSTAFADTNTAKS